MQPIKLTYGNEAFEEIRAFLKSNYREDYSLSLFNIAEKNAVDVICKFDEMLDVIARVSAIEHDFPSWIGLNELSGSYVVGMNFTRGIIVTPAVYSYENGELSKLQ